MEMDMTQQRFFLFRAGLMALLLATGVVKAEAGDILPEPRPVSPNTWAWIGPYGGPTAENRGFRMNLGYVVGTDAVAVIDSGYGPDMAAEMLHRIRSHTDLPVRYVINTNSQAHRFMGNPVFREQGATIVAAKDAVERMQSDGAAFAQSIERTLELPAGHVQPPSAPDVLVESRKTLDLGGGVTLTVEDMGSTHTHGSLAVHVAPDNVVFAGDVLYGGRLLAVLPVGDMSGWIEAFDRLASEYEGALFIPGHGEPGSIEEFRHPTRDYLAALMEHMDAAVEHGTDMQSAINSFDAGRWQDLADFDDLAPRNANIAYQESERRIFGF
jgi:glyoxylase-like metal-dependent hydrolase (beta-lactamase superfamily II)